MSLKQIIILLISLIYFIGCYKYLNSNLFQPCCNNEEAISESSENTSVLKEVSENAAPLIFGYNNATPQTSNKFEDFKNDLILEGEDMEGLVITGLYYEDEDKPENFDDMGLFRAMKTQELLSPSIDISKIKIVSKKVDKGSNVDNDAFEAVEFEWIGKKEFESPKASTTADGDLRILFNSNSTKFEENSELDDYLSALAEKLNGDKSLIAYIVGYTDGVGEPGPNRRLSEARARKVRRILRDKGVSRNQLIAKGKGESGKIAPNTTEAGRRLNRRVEIRLDTRDK